MKKPTFKRGDYVRTGAGPVGVVRLRPKKTAPIEVYYMLGQMQFTREYEEKVLSLVPAHEAPPYAVKLKAGLGLSGFRFPTSVYPKAPNWFRSFVTKG
jgi:hypothetical protein